ncbi:MAG TPA: hypothetical protein VKZ53_24155 [Candidatus Angelobacter sp.]|nr:hypothetical protein [Candidatus Angelobacter sp.]
MAAYVACEDSSTISVINTATNTVTATITLTGPFGLVGPRFPATPPRMETPSTCLATASKPPLRL